MLQFKDDKTFHEPSVDTGFTLNKSMVEVSIGGKKIINFYS